MFQLDYALSFGLAIAVLLFFPLTKHIHNPIDKRSYYRLQLVTLLGAVVGAKLSVVFGEHGWPFAAAPDWGAFLLSGRSVTGALLGGFLAAEITKPIVGYRLPPNDRFAAILPFSMAIGRVGCWSAGCCRGLPWNGPWAIQTADGVNRHPAQIYELLFQLILGTVLLWAFARGRLFGRLFALYLILYGLFRFAIEPLRDTPKLFAGFSGYQFLALLMVAVGAITLTARTLRQPSTWQEFGTRPTSSGRETTLHV